MIRSVEIVAFVEYVCASSKSKCQLIKQNRRNRKHNRDSSSFDGRFLLFYFNTDTFLLVKYSRIVYLSDKKINEIEWMVDVALLVGIQIGCKNLQTRGGL